MHRLGAKFDPPRKKFSTRLGYRPYMLLRTTGPVSAGETEEMVHAAQQGDSRSFTLLFQLHYAGMLGVAYQMLGHVPDAEDACQDASIIAFARIGDLRDASAVRPWLHAIVRNNCRAFLRTRRPVAVGVAGENLLASAEDDPVTCIERSAQRDWIWHALRQLTPATQTVAMLRYFTENNSYEQISTLCGIPVGTVRSRLSEARRQLAIVLPLTSDESHDATAALHAERCEEAVSVLSAVSDSVPMNRVARRWAKDLAFLWPDGTRTVGLQPLIDTFRLDYDAGVGHRITGVVAGAGVTIWENAFINPPDDPFHCPPGATWLLHENDGMVTEVRFMRTPRPAPPKADRSDDRTFPGRSDS
ncbi:RNA polymerase sigma factor [Paractinoplanes durhamensis]|uniref:DNA-directed RNA polymerase sigma-70 factor n=1 Tax=Paractinoplanes durhamensis TaxID=113563 RepID=A0ABQ3ZD38_9ACTN|nr:sigma-70 family RNA polymerase sigma factor [Actinoplanes durhamensis]GIE07715.1 DNA-directed RNA polymerase sigma-70 factor [Actinoplanes durhamensis]